MSARYPILLLIATFFCAAASFAHPGSAIAVSKGGVVYFVDTGAGIFSIDATGKLVHIPGPGFHFFAFDPDSRYQKTPWPYMPGAEFRSVGVHPTMILSSDFPATIGADGTFYHSEGSNDRVHIAAIAPSGAKSVRATLPPVYRGGAIITWLNGLAAGSDGSLYYTEDRNIRKIDARGHVSSIATNVTVPHCTAIPGVEPELGPDLRGLAVAADGSIYVAASGCGALLKVDSKGHAVPYLRTAAPWSPTGVAINGSDIYVLEYLHTASDNRLEWIPRIRKIDASGKVTILPGNTRN